MMNKMITAASVFWECLHRRRSENPGMNLEKQDAAKSETVALGWARTRTRLHLRVEVNPFQWLSFFLVHMISPSKYLLAGFLALWPSITLASGWNDFSREIGHGFKISKTDHFHVCLSYKKNSKYDSTIVCGNPEIGNYGRITGFAFTDKHLLVRTTGVKPSEDPGSKFDLDWDREYFFIVKKGINNPRWYKPIGPLDRDEFHANSAVPAQIQWERPTRFAAAPPGEGDMPTLEFILWLVVLVSIIVLPFILFYVAVRIVDFVLWRLYRWGRRKLRIIFR